MKKSEIAEMVRDLQAELEGVEEELRMELSKLRVELEEVKSVIEGLRNAKHFNPLERIGPVRLEGIPFDTRLEQIKQEMDQYISDWPDPSNVTCTTLICDKDENNPTQSK